MLKRKRTTAKECVQMAGSQAGRQPGRDELVEEFLRASRTLVGLALHSVNTAPVEVTLLQHRVLVLLLDGERTVGDIAGALGVNPSNATRHCDRLGRLGLVSRRRSTSDGRVVRVGLTDAGREVVEAVTAQRRGEVARVLDTMPVEDAAAVVAALRAFSDAADALPEGDWATTLG